jgi:excinuclease ABC subunit C
MEKIKIINKNSIEKLPKTSGVYLFYEKNKIIYIGKAINIKNRVKNHFHLSRRSFSKGGTAFKDNLFVQKIDKIGYLQTNSEIEALILEANLIKKYQPKFNVVWRDDKNYFYVAIAKNNKKIPFVYITHQPENQPTRKPANQYIGPFIEGTPLKKTLKFLRRAIPYYTSKNHSKNKCTWCHLGLCPGPAINSSLASEISNGTGPYLDLPQYKKNIKKLILILEGKKSAVLNSLKKEMKNLAKNKNFEEAGKIRDKIFSLEKIMAHAHVIEAYNLNLKTQNWNKKTEKTLRRIIGANNPISKIEAYDVSNIQGKNATASMVVFKNGTPDKSQYKKFKIKTKNEPNDIAMLKEALGRRFKHPEWEYPDLILIDGGKAQLNATTQTREQFHRIAPLIISIAKGKQELFIEGKKDPVPLKSLPQEVYNLIKYLDDEAHRFAIKYHQKLRSHKTFT